MGTHIDLRVQRDDLLQDAGIAPEVAVEDFLYDVRRVKRLTQTGVYTGLLVTVPCYYLLLGFSLLQLGVYIAVSLAIATAAIEGAFHEMYKLRKRSAYPGAAALTLGGLNSFDAACEAMVVLMTKLLRLRGCFLTVQNDSGFLTLVAINGVGRADADRYLRLGAGCVQRAISSGEPTPLWSGELQGQGVVPPGENAIFVPVKSFRRVIGVIALLADSAAHDLRDRELLVSLGIALGVSLENLRQRDELRTLAAVDELTRVYNRRYFFDQLDREIAACRRYSASVSVLTFDLDGLKELNDTLGHGVGDQALSTLAQRLVRFSRAADIVARLGGDEFAVILPRTDREGATEIARRLQRSVESEPLPVGEGQQVSIQVSCGAATFPTDAADASMLLLHADSHMYAAKAARAGGRKRKRG